MLTVSVKNSQPLKLSFPNRMSLKYAVKSHPIPKNAQKGELRSAQGDAYINI